MNDQKFGMETKHDGPCFVYEDHDKAIDVMKGAKSLRPELINGKKLERIKGLAKTYAETSSSLQGYAAGALKVMAIYDTPLDQAMSEMLGIKSANHVGVTICKTCLQNAMLACEEVLQTLRDIEDVCK